MRYRNKLFTVLIATIAIWGFTWSAQLFVAGNAFYNVKNVLDTWQESPDRASFKQAENALVNIRIAINYFPQNALYYQMEGQVYEWLAFTTQTNKVSFLSEASLSYQKSLYRRPTWAGSWIGLASIKWKKGQLDDTFYVYLDKAIEVGPQDAITHAFIAEYGLAMLQARSIHYVKIKNRLKLHVLLGLQNPLSRNQVLTTIDKYNAKQTVCSWLITEPISIPFKLLGC